MRPDGWRDGQQRHGRRTAGGSRGGARGAGRRLAREPALARPRHRRQPDHIRDAAALVRQVRPRAVAMPYWIRSSPRSRRREPGADRGRLQQPACAGIDAGTDDAAWKPEWVCYYFINDSRRRRSSSTCRACTTIKRRALQCHVSQFKVSGDDGGADAADLAAFPAARREPRCAVRRPRRRRVRRGRRGSRTAPATEPVQMRDPDLNIGIICYASVGGSGIVATELAKALAIRGHQVHLVSSDPPFRLGDYQAGLMFHQVETPSYPLFREPQYVLSLANKIVQVAREFQLDIIHAHYAIPHATAAILARQVLAASRSSSSRGWSRRCTGPTSRWLGAIRRTLRSWPTPSSSRTASPPYRRASATRRAASCSVQRDDRSDSQFPRLRCLPPSRRRASPPAVRAGRRRRSSSSTCRTSGRSSGSTP